MAPTPDSLLDGALAIFDELGYGAATVPAIARRAGIAVGSVYRHFSSKEQLANALYRREKQRLAESLFAAVDLDAEPAVVFAAVWEHLCDFAVESPAALGFLELHHHGAYLDAESVALAANLDAVIAGVVASWQARGVVRAGDPQLLTAQVFGGFVGVVRQCRAMGRAIDASLREVTCEPAWNLLAGAKEPSVV